MNNKLIYIVLQLPLQLIILASFFAGIYASIKDIGGISWAVPIIIGIVILLYVLGRYLENKMKGGFY
jgi:uncharacterized membrane protein (DUF485 family)